MEECRIFLLYFFLLRSRNKSRWSYQALAGHIIFMLWHRRAPTLWNLLLRHLKSEGSKILCSIKAMKLTTFSAIKIPRFTFFDLVDVCRVCTTTRTHFADALSSNGDIYSEFHNCTPPEWEQSQAALFDRCRLPRDVSPHLKIESLAKFRCVFNKTKAKLQSRGKIVRQNLLTLALSS